MVDAANIRALEAWLATLALTAHVPFARAASATVAVVPEGHRATVIVILWLSPWAWLFGGVMHLWAYLRLRDVIGFSRNGYRVRIWVTG